MPIMLSHNLVRETTTLVQRRAGNLPRPLIVRLSPRGVTVWAKGTHEKYTLSFDELYELGRHEHNEPLTVFAERAAGARGCLG